MRTSNVAAVAAQMRRKVGKQRRKENMDREVRRAMLGDRDAQERLTERGVLLPCPCCGGEAKFKKGFPSRQIAHCRQAVVQCKKCGVRTVTHRQLPMERWQDVDKAAISEWNLRAPILSAEELERLEDNHDE